MSKALRNTLITVMIIGSTSGLALNNMDLTIHPNAGGHASTPRAGDGAVLIASAIPVAVSAPGMYSEEEKALRRELEALGLVLD